MDGEIMKKIIIILLLSTSLYSETLRQGNIQWGLTSDTTTLWRCNEGNGSVTYDSFNGYADGAWGAGISWVKGKFGTAIQGDGLRGGTGYIDFYSDGNRCAIEYTQPWTIECWFRPQGRYDGDSSQVIFGKIGKNLSNGWYGWGFVVQRINGYDYPAMDFFDGSNYIYWQGDTAVSTTTLKGDAAYQYLVIVNTGCSAGTWTISNTSANTCVSMYLDGIKQNITQFNNTISASAISTIQHSEVGLCYGHWFHQGEGNALSILDEARITMRALTPAEIRYRYEKSSNYIFSN